MGAHKKTVEAMQRHYRSNRMVRNAAAEPPPPPFQQQKGGGFDHESGGQLKRAIPEGYSFDPRSLKPLAKTLWAMSVALGHAMTAHRQFTKLKSGTVSPDGLLGGRGYVMSVKDMRKELYQACEALSAISDTIHDELNAPHWKPKLSQLERDDVESIGRLVGDAERILEDPEGEADEEMDDAEEGEGLTKGAPWQHPAVRDKDKAKDEPGSEIPSGGDQETLPEKRRPDQNETGQPLNRVPKQSSAYTYNRQANSSLPVETMPGGPRVDHLDRAEPRGEANTYNESEPSMPQGDRGTEVVMEPPREYDYPSDWENDFSHTAASGLPDAVTEPTPTEGFDYGIGLGEGNDAHGQGQEHEVSSPSGKGVFGPAAELPSDPGGEVHDDTAGHGSLSLTEQKQLAKGPHRQATAVLERWRSKNTSTSQLPNDDQPPSAAAKGGRPGELETVTWAASDVPGDGIPSKDAPLRGEPVYAPDHALAQSTLPDEEPVTYNFERDPGPREGYRYERTNQPYIKWDYTTHKMRPDPVHQRDVEGPYVQSSKEVGP